MKPGWNQLMESGFDRSLYSDKAPGGTWSARIEQSAWAKLLGIHLFVVHLGNSERFWLFVPYTRHELYTLFRDLPDGSAVELSVRRGVRGSLPRILNARSVEAHGNGASFRDTQSHHAPARAGRAETRGGGVRRRSLRRVKGRADQTVRRRVVFHRGVPVKRRRTSPPTPSLPLSAFRMVVVWWMDAPDDEQVAEYIVHQDHVRRFVEATVRLHYAPGINPHAGVRLRVARKVTVAEFEAQGPYWYTTPSLMRNGEPRGAVIFGAKLDRTVWRNPAAPDEVTLCDQTL